MFDAQARTPLIDDLRQRQCRSWQGGDRVLVEALLHEHPNLQSDPDGILMLVYQEVLLRERLGEKPQLDEYCRRFPHLTPRLQRLFEVHNALESGGLLAFRQSQPPAEPGGPFATRREPAVEAGTPPAVPAGAPSLPGYEMLGEVGHGGAGVVYKARQKGLDRLVAVKLLLAGVHARPEELKRFRREAEAQAKLQHPHIVQIHEVGETAVEGSGQAVHYLVMEYLGGGTLAERLAGKPQPARAAAALVETLARAMQAAHQHGLVHRDLKPGNVLLASDGETSAAALGEAVPKIADFGLVKRLEADGPASTGGGIVGTPSYMAPEQAAGGRVVGPVTDVYALGAILYELLTGRPPFLGESVLGTLRLVEREEPVPVRRLNPEAPRDLETICLKCLQKEPARRYASAAALADDLRRFQAGEPVQARPVGPLGRLGRWCRRKPAQAALGAALLLAVAAGFAGVTWQWLRADEKSRLADENYERARKAVDEFTTLLRNEPLLKEPGLHAYRKTSLETMQRYYREFIEQKSHDPSLRLELAQAYVTIALIIQEIGTIEEALAALQVARDFQEKLLREEPENRHFQGYLAETLCLLAAMQNEARLSREERLWGRYWLTESPGALQGETRQDREALENAERARSLAAQLVQLYPDVRRYRHLLAQACINLSVVHLRSGRYPAAQQCCDEAQKQLVPLLEQFPDESELDRLLALSHQNLCAAHHRGGRLKEAFSAWQKAHRIFEKLERRRPPTAEAQRDLAASCRNGARLLVQLGNRKEALRYSAEAWGLLERLAESYPQVADYQLQLATALQYHAQDQNYLGQKVEAADTYEKVKLLYARRVKAGASDSPDQRALLRAGSQLGALRLEAGQLTEARTALEETREGWEAFMKSVPPLAEDEHELAQCYSLLGQVQIQRKQFAEALGPLGKARDMQEKLLEANPALPGLAVQLTRTHGRLGVALGSMGDLRGSLPSLERCRDLQAGLSAARPDALNDQSELAVCWANLGATLGNLKRREEALAAFKQAVALQLVVHQKDPQAVVYRAKLSYHLRTLAMAQRQLGKHAAAASTALLRQKFWSQDPVELSYAAVEVARCIPLVGRDKSELSADEQAERQKYGDLALDALRQAVKYGFKDVKRLREAPDLEPLRDREDFRKLLAEIEAKAKQE